MQIPDCMIKLPFSQRRANALVSAQQEAEANHDE